MKIKSEKLISDLLYMTRSHIEMVEKWKEYSDEQLNHKPRKESWSALECLEHLNLYGDFYIPEITMRISTGKDLPEDIFRSGWLGNYFAKTMMPGEKLNKMKTFKDKNPEGSRLDIRTLNRFLNQQEEMLKLLEKARAINLNKIRTSVSISKFIKLKLGDTFRIIIYHNYRHIIQGEKALKIR
jgi:hypothetical protein